VLVLRDGAVVDMLRGDEVNEDRIMHAIAQASEAPEGSADV
jgi:hypothetical protein